MHTLCQHMHTLLLTGSHEHAHVHALLGQAPRDIFHSIPKWRSEMSDPSLLLSYCAAHFFWMLSPTLIIFSPPFSPLFFVYTHMLRQMNINSLNQCSFWAINLICAFYPHCLDVRWQTFVLQCCGKRQHSYASKGLYLERGFVWWRKGGRLRWWGEWRGRER